jgi:hypothetical protein
MVDEALLGPSLGEVPCNDHHDSRSLPHIPSSALSKFSVALGQAPRRNYSDLVKLPMRSSQSFRMDLEASKG